MALAVTIPVAVLADTSNVESYSFAAFTPSANSLLVVFVNAIATVAEADVSGGSLTWFPLMSVIGGSTRRDTCFFAEVGASPASTTITWTCTGDAATGVVGIVYQITGYNTGKIFGSYNFKGNTTGANPFISLDRNMNTNNAYMAMYSSTTNNPPTSTQPASWTEDADTGFGSPTTGISAAHRIGGESSNTVTFTAASQTYDILFVEVNEASEGQPMQLSSSGVG